MKLTTGISRQMEFQGHFDQIVDWDNEFYFPEWKLYNDSIISFTDKYKIIDLVWFSNTGNFEVTTYVCKFKEMDRQI